jgi:hypothetical protein
MWKGNPKYLGKCWNFWKRNCPNRAIWSPWCPGSPDGVFSKQKSQFGNILEVLAMLVYLMATGSITYTAIWYALWSFCIFIWYVVPRKIWEPCIKCPLSSMFRKTNRLKELHSGTKSNLSAGNGHEVTYVHKSHCAMPFCRHPNYKQ